MPKTAIIPIDYHSIQSLIDFKKTILLFDKIVIEEQSLGLARSIAELAMRHVSVDKTNFDFNNQNIDFLLTQGLIEIDSINKPISVTVDSLDDIFIKEAATKWRDTNRFLSELKTGKNQEATLTVLMDSIKQLPTIFARAISIRLRNEGVESYPVFDTVPNYDNIGKKETILKFLLSKMPVPSDETSWEQIFDFRNDTTTSSKYNALIHWVNKISKGEATLSEIEDEYNYLYSDYVEQFKIHRMKYKLRGLEIFVCMALDLVGNPIAPTGISAFRIFQSEVKLLEAESKFTGREISYIHKATETFG